MCVYARVAGTFLPSIRRSQMVLALGATITLHHHTSGITIVSIVDIRATICYQYDLNHSS